MAAGHQLKKLAQSRGSNHHHVGPVTKQRFIEYMPKHWSAYTLIFSTASLMLFCFLFYDMQSSPTSLLLHAGRQMGALKAQMSESYFFSSTPTTSPSEVVVQDGSEVDKVQLPGIETEQKDKLISKDEMLLIREEFPDDPVEESTLVKPLPEVVPDTIVEIGDVLKEDSKETLKVSTKEEAKKGDVVVEDVKVSDTESFSEESSNIELEVEETVEASDALEEEGASSEKSITDGSCDLSVGKWVYDETYPIYKPNTCPFADGGFRCVENGRPSSEFQSWRWQPSGCDLPRFDAKQTLERLRDSRMVFVGDSIGRNNWESMLCMLSEAVSDKSRVYEINGEAITKHSGFLIYRFADYNFTVEYFRSPYLVPQGRAPPNTDSKVRSTLKLDMIDWTSSKWRTADVVVLNTGHWWSFEKTVRGGNYFQEGKKVHLNMTVGEAFRRAMVTVARFVERDMDPRKSQVFFRSYAPVHFKGGTWDKGGTCNSDTRPLQKFPFIWADATPSVMIRDVMETNVKNPVNFLNITYLSDLRPDGHSSIWQRVPPSPKNHQDCSHWCLPGVPDTWNEILFATLLKNGKGKWGRLDENI